jgi:hypothetical protein
MWTTVSFWKTGKPRAYRQREISRRQSAKPKKQQHFTMSRDVARGRKQGIMSVLVDEAWIHVTPGSFILVLGGVTHDFENRSDTRAGVLNLSIPGSFERPMPYIAQWFAENPPKDAGIYPSCVYT